MTSTTWVTARVDWRRLWNWKSALVSAVGRAPVFFVANLPAGRSAALAALATELVYRAVAAGFFGALTGMFARHASRRRATLAAILVLPALAHSVEYLVHFAAGTPHIATAMLGSIAISICTTRFSLFVMRRGLFVPGSQSFTSDVIALGRLLLAPLVPSARRPAPEVTAAPPQP